jgi:hypothetical protein
MHIYYKYLYILYYIFNMFRVSEIHSTVPEVERKELRDNYIRVII